jgi:sensor c-di-GMP phosphodiesterase-like protein
VGLAWVAALLSIAVPVWFGVHLSRVQGLEAATERVLMYARRVLWRVDNVIDQVGAVTDRLGAAAVPDSCSPAAIQQLRELDFVSRYVQTIGYVSGNRLLCTSLGAHGEGLPLGEPDIVTSVGVRVWKHVKLFADRSAFLVVANKGYAGVVHESLITDVATADDSTSLAVFTSPDPRAVVTERGLIAREWSDRLRDGFETSFVDRDHIVAVARSRKYGTPGAIAALPISYVDSRARTFAWAYVPVAVAAGLVLSLAIAVLARRQMALPAMMRAALRRGEIFVLYQPVVELASGRWTGVEALVRWRRPTGELVRPDLFIPVAEESGFISLITERVIEFLRHDAPRMLEKRADFHIGLNLASADLESERTVRLVRTLARDIGAGPGNLMVEASERRFLNTDRVRRVVNEIRAGGCRVAIDDFGTGYSSLAYLETFELDYLKIDKSFVDTIGTDAAASQVVLHIIEMAKSLKLEMIAEGVETEAQAAFLRERGVQHAQGWLFAKPMPPDELVARLAAGAAESA